MWTNLFFGQSAISQASDQESNCELASGVFVVIPSVTKATYEGIAAQESLQSGIVGVYAFTKHALLCRLKC